ncbi:hypothetical protein CPB84DRAFT_1783252 [Gymnopilus junonius]|uniref:Uncharacterized protein n=1 Tax=Gymnopilus junonius TaxID=109634 RepID=A0A9P5NJX9_GYMJU|nr:hypothetical protein CPB84DRAFT_1783252 [Gymnopilus junonius]
MSFMTFLLKPATLPGRSGAIARVHKHRFITRSSTKPTFRSTSTLIIKTLDPRKLELSAQPIYDLSGLKFTRLLVPSENGWVSAEYRRIDNSRLPFPPGTAGVLYYNQPPAERPPISGALRFRILSDVSKFDEGEDLVFRRRYEDGVWQVPLYNLVKADKWLAVRSMLVKEALVDKELIAGIQKFPGFSTGRVNYHYELGQPFVIDFESNIAIARILMTRSMRHLFRWTPMPYVHNHVYKVSGRNPYLGRILVRLELSHPSNTPGIKQNLVLRVLDILKPFQSTRSEGDFLAPPVPGELLTWKRFGLKEMPLFYPLAKRPGGQNIAEFAGIPWL